jgi:hypothetical protein
MNTYVATHQTVADRIVLRVESLPEYQARVTTEAARDDVQIVTADNLTVAYRLATRSLASRN